MTKISQLITIKNSLYLFFGSLITSLILNLAMLYQPEIMNFLGLSNQVPGANDNIQELSQNFAFFYLIRNIVTIISPIVVFLTILSIFGLIYSIIKTQQNKKDI